MNLDPMIHLIPDDQLAWVFDQDCDIDAEFLGFTNIYANLASIIPLHWTIIDFGCAYAPQAWLFKDHRKYVGVDVGDRRRFHAPNTEHVVSTIHDFIRDRASLFDIKTTFAICSYVPDWHHKNRELVRAAFDSVFTYYPAGDPAKRIFPTT